MLALVLLDPSSPIGVIKRQAQVDIVYTGFESQFKDNELRKSLIV